MKKWQFISFVLALCLIFSVFAFLNKETLVGKEEQTAEQSDTVGGADDGTTAPESTEPEVVPATWVKSDDLEVYDTDIARGVKISFAANTLYRLVFDDVYSADDQFIVGTEEPYYDDVNEDYVKGYYFVISSGSYPSYQELMLDEFYQFEEDTVYYIYSANGKPLIEETGDINVTLYELQGDLDSLEYTSCAVSAGHIDGDRFAVAWPEYTLKLVKFELPEGMNFDPDEEIYIGDDNSASCSCGSSITAFLLEYDSENNIVYAAFDYIECSCNYVYLSGFDCTAHQVKVSCVDLGMLDITE